MGKVQGHLHRQGGAGLLAPFCKRICWTQMHTTKVMVCFCGMGSGRFLWVQQSRYEAWDVGVGRGWGDLD